MSVHLLILGISLLCLLQRFLLTWRQQVVFDSWGHIYFTLAIKDQRAGPFGPITPNVVEAGPYYYPFLVHWLMSHLPRNLILKYSQLINPLADAAFLAIHLELFNAAGFDPTVNVWAGLVFIFTPLFFSKVAIGPRVSNFSTRIYSELILSSYFLLVFLNLGLPNWLNAVICVTLICGVVLSSKFGVQAVIFLGVPVAIITWNGFLLLSLCLGFVAAFLVSGGHFGKMLDAQYKHLKWYVRHMRDGKAFVGDRNRIARLIDWKSSRTFRGNIMELVFNFVGRNSYTAVLIKAPIVPAVVVLFAMIQHGRSIDASVYHLIQICLIAIFVFLTINTKWLLFLGEAERYISHVAIIVCLAFAFLARGLGFDWMVYSAVAYGAAFTVVEILLLGGLSLNSTAKLENLCAKKLNELGQRHTVVSYPYHLLPPYRIMAKTTNRTVFPILATGEGVTLLKEFEVYPRIELERLDEMADRYGVDIAFINSKDQREKFPDWKPNDRLWHVELLGADDANGVIFLQKR